MADVARSNTLFGAGRSAMQVLRGIIPPALSRKRAARPSVRALGYSALARGKPGECRRRAHNTIGLDARSFCSTPLAGTSMRSSQVNALRLPFRDNSIDVVLCSQLLHHFVEEDARRLCRQLHRVSRGWVVISGSAPELGAGGSGFWLAASPFPVSSGKLDIRVIFGQRRLCRLRARDAAP